MEFSLERFEHLAYSRQQEPAAQELQQLLALLDANFGNLSDEFSSEPLGVVPAQETDLHIATRIASAISALFSDPTFFLSPVGFSQFITWQRWLSVIFATSAFRNADHIIRALNINGGDLKNLVLDDERKIIKFCLLYTAESEITLDIDALWAYDKNLTAALSVGLLATRFMGSCAAHSKRETLLAWLPQRLHEISNIDLLPTSILHDVYMHCTYADLPSKHDIKRALNRLIRKKLLETGYADLEPPHPTTAGEKPTMLIVLEWFGIEHAVYRVLSKALRAMNTHFRLVALGFEHLTDETGRALFDEFIPIVQIDLRQQLELVRETAQRTSAQVLFMPSLGMTLLTIYTSNMRLAPLQVFAFGHPATSYSEMMDYFIIEDDFVGDPTCFSEKLLRLPSRSLPFVPSSKLPDNLNTFIRRRPQMVQIVVPGSLMKLNPEFLATCKAIAEQSETSVQFHFLVGLSSGLVWSQVQHVVMGYLGNAATVYPHLSYDQYMTVIGKCDMFINPFPFGNGNGVVDVLTLHLAGVCRSGREVCEHVDDGLFVRAGLPAWLITSTTEAFIAAAVRLANDHEERVQIREKLAANNAVARLFTGNAFILGDRLIELVRKTHEYEPR